MFMYHVYTLHSFMYMTENTNLHALINTDNIGAFKLNTADKDQSQTN